MSEKFEQWCIVDLFGHTRLAGMVTEQTIGGQSFVRVDIPQTTKQAAFTRLFGSGAIYAINPVSESVAKAMAESLQVVPISAWDLPEEIRNKIRAGEKLLAAKTVPNDESAPFVTVDTYEQQDDDDFDEM